MPTTPGELSVFNALSAVAQDTLSRYPVDPLDLSLSLEVQAPSEPTPGSTTRTTKPGKYSSRVLYKIARLTRHFLAGSESEALERNSRNFLGAYV